MKVSNFVSNFKNIFATLNERCPYGFGSKWGLSLASLQNFIGTRVDCSGFVRFLLFRASGGKIQLPDGSYVQKDYCKKQGFRRLKSYADVQYAARDSSRMFLCFMSPIPGIAGHVWIVYLGQTYESCGRNNRIGVSSQDWSHYNKGSFLNRARDLCAFEIPLAQLLEDKTP